MDGVSLEQCVVYRPFVSPRRIARRSAFPNQQEVGHQEHTYFVAEMRKKLTQLALGSHFAVTPQRAMVPSAIRLS